MDTHKDQSWFTHTFEESKQGKMFHVEVHKHNTRIEMFGIQDQKETNESTNSGTLDNEVSHISDQNCVMWSFSASLCEVPLGKST